MHDWNEWVVTLPTTRNIRILPSYTEPMISVNVTYALLSTLYNNGDFFCVQPDVSILFPTTATSPIQMFRCLVIQDSNMPTYCDSEFYSSLRSGCVSCTFSTLTITYLSCFQQCATDASSDYCKECSSSYLTGWQSTCASDISIPQIETTSTSEASCTDSTFAALGGVEEMASDLTSCLAVNNTRSIDCMTTEGYTSLPSACSDCLFSTQSITDSVCASVCPGRPYSGMCRKCISSFVSTTVMRCFQYTTFPATFEPSCTADELTLIGTDSTVISELVNDCATSVACSVNNDGLAVGSQGTIGNTCMDCLNVGYNISSTSCDSLGRCDSVITDCVVTPLSQPLTESGSCSLADASLMVTNSDALTAINSCIYQLTSIEGLTGCLSASEAAFTSTCMPCLVNALPSFNNCAVSLACATDLKSTDCQTCIATAYENAFLSCYASGVDDSCTLTEVAIIAGNQWGLALFQRCIATNTTLPTNCFATADVFASNSPSDDCQKCLSDAVSRQCAITCASSPYSSDCATCTNLMASDITKACTVNPTLVAQGFHTTKSSTMGKLINYTVLGTVLIQSLAFIAL